MDDDIHSSFWNTTSLKLNRTDNYENKSYCYNSSYLCTEVSLSYIPSWWQQFCWGIVFGVLVFVATIGNTIVIWIILAHRRMRTVTNYFLLNLSVADFLIATFNVIFSFTYMIKSHWPFGTVYCVFSNFIANLSVSTSVFTMSAMSIDRFFAIVFPLKPKTPKRQIVIVILIIWICGVLLSSPTLIYSTTSTFPSLEGNRTLCLLRWPDGYSGKSTDDYVYNVIFLLMTYVVPMVFLIVTYTWMIQVLWGNKGIGETTEVQMEAVKSKRKVVKMLIAVVLTFAICWLPYHVYFLYAYHHTEFQYTYYVQHIYLSIYWLAMSNSMYNPLVYYWMNKRFRTYFQVVLCCCRKKRIEDMKCTAPTTNMTLSIRQRSLLSSCRSPNLRNGSRKHQNRNNYIKAAK